MDRDAVIVKLLQAEVAYHIADVNFSRLSLAIQAHVLSILLCRVLAVNSSGE